MGNIIQGNSQTTARGDHQTNTVNRSAQADTIDNLVRQVLNENQSTTQANRNPQTQGAQNIASNAANQMQNLGFREQSSSDAVRNLGRQLLSPNTNNEQKVGIFKQLVQAHGGQIRNDGTHMIALRGMDINGQLTNDTQIGPNNLREDSFATLKNGKVETFYGSTQPTEANRNKPTGEVAPGNYKVDFYASNYGNSGMPGYSIRTPGRGDSARGYRDWNQDGHITDTERQRGANIGNARIHPAGGSIGCHIMPESQYRRFSNEMGRSSFNYTVIDMN